MQTQRIGIVLLLFLFLGVLAYFFFSPRSLPSQSPAVSTQSKSGEPVPTTITNLDVPWEMVFLPDNTRLVTERGGTVRLITADGALKPEPIAEIAEVKEIGEGGLLGMALHPEFASNQFIFFYYTYDENNGATKNRVVRYTYKDNTLTDRLMILDAIPGASNHNGGRIKFGPDGYLYITTGDAGVPSLAQDRNSLAGKILRVTPKGLPAPGNPFNNRTYSYGHRNPQGLSWDSTGQLWETEHGPSAHDEVNKITAGGNYGWPEITGTEKRAGMISPIAESGTGTWAPSGLTMYNNQLYFAGLRGQALFRMSINDSSPTAIFQGEYGRIRNIVLGPDTMFYFMTNNRDGRGIPKSDDDQIIMINPSELK